jgi:hypothetical protein
MADLDREMEVVVHQAISEEGEPAFSLQLGQTSDEQNPVSIIGERFPPVDAPGHRMIGGPGIMYPCSSHHYVYD